MDALNPRRTPDFDSMVQKVLVEWRKLPPEARNDRNSIEELLRDSYHFSLDATEWDILEKRLNAALAKEEYTGEPLEALNETRRLITRCVLEEFIHV